MSLHSIVKRLGYKGALDILVLTVISIQAYVYYKQLQLGYDQEYRQLRAYVGTSDFRVSDKISDDTIIVKQIIKNFGSTPAFNVSSLSRPEIFPATERSVYPEPSGLLNDFGINTTLYPGNEISIFHRVKLSIVNKRLVEGTDVVVIYGKTLYRDAFDLPHEDKYCILFTRIDLDDFSKMGKDRSGLQCKNSNGGN